MGYLYLNFCSYWKNLTYPLVCLHRGTAFQFEVMKDHPKIPVVFTDLGTDVVMVTMAARIMQSIISLAKNLLQKRVFYWKILPRICVNIALQKALRMCWSILNLLLPLLVTTVYNYKNWLKWKKTCNMERPMNTVTIKCHWGSLPEPDKMIVEEMCSLEMKTIQESAKMEVEHEFEGMVSKEVLSSCTNPVILSMIYMPSEHGDSSEESEVDIVDEGLEGDCSQEDMSMDSGMQELCTPKSKYTEDGSDESDWSDDDSWDEESDLCTVDEDLWASFCRSDDPYNPLSFAMPTKCPDQPKKEAPVKSLETCQNLGSVPKIVCDTVTEKTTFSKKPVLSGYKSSHKCLLQKEELPEDNLGTKRVRFSPKVTVHPIITWDFAHRMARKGPWEEYARDRCRFQKRIAETEAAIGFCLEPHHRDKIWSTLYSK